MWLLTPRAQAAAAPQDDEAQLRLLGVRQEQIDAAHANRAAEVDDDGDEFGLWAWHFDALRLFEAMSTQWSVIGTQLGIMHMGLRYEVLDAVCARLGLKAHDAELFDQLRTLERAGARVLNGGAGAA